MSTKTIISKEELLQHWLGHRKLTRKTMEKFPEKELFKFSIGGMRPFADLVKELLSIDVPALQEIVSGETKPFNHDLPLHTKAALLQQWDEDTLKIVEYVKQLSAAQFNQTYKVFGMYEFTLRGHLLYFIDNEIHHRGQGFVYLRALGIEPPFFWDRD